MFNAIVGIIVGGAVGAAVWWLYKQVKEALRQDREYHKTQQRVIETFRAMLAEQLKEHQPKITVWIPKNNPLLQPHAVVRVGKHQWAMQTSGKVYRGALGVDTKLLQLYVDDAAAFFDKKQLMKWIDFD